MKELPKAYEFSTVEEKLYAWWEKEGFFKPSNDPKAPNFDPAKKPYVISIPPPNVTATLSLQAIAPMGSPPPIAFAMVTQSGLMP